MLAATVQAQERPPTKTADADVLRESIRREIARVGHTQPQTAPQKSRKGLSRGDKVMITTGIGIAAGLLIGAAMHEKGYDLAPYLGLGAMIGGGAGVAVGFSW